MTRRHWLKSAALAGAVAHVPVCRAADAAAAEPKTLTPAQQEALRGVVNDALARKALPGGALALLSHGRVVFREGFGRTEFDGGKPFSPDLPCFIASVSKPISATYFTMLHERGVVSLDDAVEKYLPQFKGVRVQGKGPATRTMRVWHLLSHRSGLPGNTDMGDARPQRVARAAKANQGPAASPGLAGVIGADSFEEVIARWLKEELHAEPGERFAYGGAGYMVAARIAEVVLGRRFESLFEEALLQPLGMKRTTFHPDAETLARTPARYVSTANGVERDPRLPLPNPGGLINPAGGLCAPLDDLTAFLALHLNRGTAGQKRLLAEPSLARMYRPHPPRATEAAEGGGIGYGLGWNVVAPGGVVRHLGASGTVAWMDLKRQHAGVLVTQVKWGPGNRPLIGRLMKEVQAIFGAPA